METKLFDRLCQLSTLEEAWLAVQKKGSSGGVDQQSVSVFAEMAPDQLSSLLAELITQQYVPLPYLQINIPKDEGEVRKLGLLSIRDKIVQQAIRLVLEPILEPTFLPSSYGYRPGRGAVKAIRRVAAPHPS